MSNFNYNDIVGKVFINKKGLKYVVENFVEKKKKTYIYHIRFLDSGWERDSPRDKILSGNIHDRSTQNVYIGSIHKNYKGLEFIVLEYVGNKRYNIKFLESGCVRENIKGAHIIDGHIRDTITHPIKVQVGNTYFNNNGNEFIVLECTKPTWYKIKFINTGLIREVEAKHILDGAIKDYMEPSVYGVGIIGADLPGNFSKCKEYTIWKGMIDRCYNIHNPMYEFYGARGVTVCDRWLIYVNFLHDLPYIDGYNEYEFINGYIHLDKDLKQYHNDLFGLKKVYSLQTCTFVHPVINSMIANCNYLEIINGKIIPAHIKGEIIRPAIIVPARIFKGGD